jgi:hypothetical protein
MEIRIIFGDSGVIDSAVANKDRIFVISKPY